VRSARRHGEGQAEHKQASSRVCQFDLRDWGSSALPSSA
jgi:hypothetical protein